MTTSTFCPVLSSTTLVGESVRNKDGQSLGDIKDLMIDTETGRINYAVLDFGGFLGIGNKFFAVPWQSFTVDTDDNCLVLNVAKETLESAEGFDKDNWPNFADRTWGARIHSYYGVTPYWT